MSSLLPTVAPRADIVKAATVVPPHAAVLLERLVRLRVLTAPQARVLTPVLARHGLRAAYLRLATLVRQGWLVVDAVSPSRGAASPQYYRLSYRALVALGLSQKVGLLQRPAQHVLEYLIFRAGAYADAVAAGWLVGSPIFLAPEKRPDALAHLNKYLRGRALQRYRAAQVAQAPAEELIRMQTELERLPAFLPRELAFEFLARLDKTHAVSTAVLLLVDDVRRSVAAQVDALPIAAKDDCPVLIRAAGARLAALRAAVIARLGPQALAVDVVLPPFNQQSKESAP
jgi:hypothetical protein